MSLRPVSIPIPKQKTQRSFRACAKQACTPIENIQQIVDAHTRQIQKQLIGVTISGVTACACLYGTAFSLTTRASPHHTALFTAGTAIGLFSALYMLYRTYKCERRMHEEVRALTNAAQAFPTKRNEPF